MYRARDTKLKRDVALKVLPETFARDPDRTGRLQREVEVLASRVGQEDSADSTARAVAAADRSGFRPLARRTPPAVGVPRRLIKKLGLKLQPRKSPMETIIVGWSRKDSDR